MDMLENTVGSAIKSCESLRLTACGLPDDTTISNLLMQLDALHTALKFLYENMSKSQDEFAALQPPVQSCWTISEDLKAGIKQASSSGLTDWASFKCGELNITDLTRKLKLFTSTVIVHMTNVGSRSDVINFTPDGLDEYIVLIKDTSSALTAELAVLEQRDEALKKKTGGRGG